MKTYRNHGPAVMLALSAHAMLMDATQLARFRRNASNTTAIPRVQASNLLICHQYLPVRLYTFISLMRISGDIIL
jgi:hypothetical protein